MCVCAKSSNRSLLERLRDVPDNYLRYNQNGICHLRSTAHNVYVVRRTFECINITQIASWVAIFC